LIKIFYLLVEIEEKCREFLSSLENLEISGRLVKWAGQWKSINNGVSIGCATTNLTRNSVNISRQLLDITLQGLQGNIALVLGIFRVQLETEEDPLEDGNVKSCCCSSLPVKTSD
jgi:hypothetical protein